MSRQGSALTLPPLDRLIACPDCDLLHEIAPLTEGQRARCRRCHSLLFAPRERAFVQVILLSLTVAILMVGAVFFPFLEISVGGVSHTSSIYDTAMAFSEGILLPLSLAVMLLIVLLPLLRVAALIYTLLPMANGRPPWRHAARAMRLAEVVQPWSMAEIFVIGTTVALVKIGGMATVGLGPAFWAFAVLVVIVTLKDALMCEWTIWSTIEKLSRR